MPSEVPDRIAVLQGTLDLIVLRTLQTMGAQHAYAIGFGKNQESCTESGGGPNVSKAD